MKSILGISLALAILTSCQTTGKPIASFNAEHGMGNGEWIAFNSSNPYDFKDYGTSKAGPTIIKGKLQFPKNIVAGTKVPVIITVHGSGGVYGRDHNWARRARERGYASFILDSFSGRQVQETTGRQLAVSEAMMTADLFEAVRLLKSHPLIDGNRIGALGFSKGAQVSLLAATDDIQRIYRAKYSFKAIVTNYPGCLYTHANKKLNAPVFIMGGSKDETTPTYICEEFVRNYANAGNNIHIKVFEGGFHGFDRTSGPWKTSKSMNLGNCSFDISASGSTTYKGSYMGNVSGRGAALNDCAGVPGSGGWHGQNTTITNEAYDLGFTFFAKHL